MSDGMSEAFGHLNRAQKEALKKYIVFYVEEQKPKVKKFLTLAQAKKFASKIEVSGDPMDNWVDYIVKGKIVK